MACMTRRRSLTLVALAAAGVGACGSRAADPPAPAVAHGERLLSREPYLGVACPEANSIACDRVGLAVWLKHRAAHVTAAVDGRSLRLRAARSDGRGAWYEGYLQPAGLLDGPLKVTPDRGRYHWAGAHPRTARVTIAVRRADGRRAEAHVRVALRAGWG
jgi:hypothetical protein